MGVTGRRERRAPRDADAIEIVIEIEQILLSGLGGSPARISDAIVADLETRIVSAPIPGDWAPAEVETVAVRRRIGRLAGDREIGAHIGAIAHEAIVGSQAGREHGTDDGVPARLPDA